MNVGDGEIYALVVILAHSPLTLKGAFPIAADRRHRQCHSVVDFRRRFNPPALFPARKGQTCCRRGTEGDATDLFGELPEFGRTAFPILVRPNPLKSV
jgi:hypothetical protein